LLPITSSGSAASSPGLVTEENGDSAAALKRKEQQKRVVGKIWAEVEKIMDEMKEELEGVLRQPNGKDEKGIEHVEKCLEWVSVEDRLWTNVSLNKPLLCRILLQLKPKEQPAWIYFDAQHRHIMDKMRFVFETQQKKVLGEFGTEGLLPSRDSHWPSHSRQTGSRERPT
jgi:exocyst complex component 2